MTRARGPAREDHSRPKTPYESVMAAALRMVSNRSYSEGELRDRLGKRSTHAGAIDECIGRLKELGYLNDDLYANSYASHRVASKPIGRARLARELALKKISPKRINAALDLVFDDVAEEKLIDRAIAKRVRTHGKPVDRGSAGRMFQHLARLGFEYDLIIRKIDALYRTGDDD